MYWVLANYVLDTVSDTVHGPSTKPMTHTTEALITPLITSQRHVMHIMREISIQETWQEEDIQIGKFLNRFYQKALEDTKLCARFSVK